MSARARHVSSDGRLLSAQLFRMSKEVGGQELALFPGPAGALHHLSHRLPLESRRVDRPLARDDERPRLLSVAEHIKEVGQLTIDLKGQRVYCLRTRQGDVSDAL